MKFLTLVSILALIWVIGLFAFADRVRSLTPAAEPARADAIVALTSHHGLTLDPATLRLDESGLDFQVAIAPTQSRASWLLRIV